MMPPLCYFTEKMKEHDIRKSDQIIIYDYIGNLSAPRTYWMLKSFGVPDVLILNGSWSKWEAEYRAVETGDTPDAWKRIRDI